MHASGHRLGALVAVTLAALLMASPPAPAAPPPDGWGFAIADDDWDWEAPGELPSLGDGFAALGPKAFRFQMIWNATDFGWHMQRARGLISRARAQGVQQIVVTFKKSVGPDVDPVYGPRPTAEGYAAHIREAIRQLAGDVDVWGPANEPNRGEAWLPGVSGAQLLAQYYASLQDAVETWDPTAETTSPDFVDRTDLGTIATYVDAYENAGGGWGDHVAFHPYWGLHNETTQTTLDVIGLAPPGADVWITEVGAFGRSPGGIDDSQSLQNDKVWWLATTLANLSQVERVHYYHMRGNPESTWDTALTNLDGSPRPAWHTWCAMAHGDLEHPACQPVTPRSPPPPPPPDPPPPDPPPPDQPPPDPPPPDQPPTDPPPAPSPASTPSGSTVDTLPAWVGCPSPTGPIDGCEAPQSGPSPDRTSPTVVIGRLARRMAYEAFMDGVALRVRPSEPSSVKAEVIVRGRRKGPGRGRYVAVATKTLPAAGGTRLVRLEPRPGPLPRKRRFVARVRIRATDLAGNRGVVTRRVRVTRQAG